MKFAIESGAYTDRYSFLAGAEKMARHGYNGIDYGYFARTGTRFFTQDEDAFRREIERHGDILRSFHIDPVQTHGPWKNPPADATEDERKVRFELFSKAIRGTAYLGSPYMILHPLMPYGANSPEHPDEVWRINLDFMHRLAEVGKKYGVVVCLENMPFKKLPLATPAEIADFVRTVNHPNLKVCLDTGHALIRGVSPAEAVRITGADLLATLHIHDNDGTRDAHDPIGTGIMDFPDFVRALGEIQYRGAISLETMADRASLYTEEEREVIEREMLSGIKKYFEHF